MSSDESGLDRSANLCFLGIFVVMAMLVGLMMWPLGIVAWVFALFLIVQRMGKTLRESPGPDTSAREGPRFAQRGPGGLGSRQHVRHVDRKVVYQVPPKCPECGASLSNEAVDWVGPLQAACPYCQATVEPRATDF